MVAQKQKVEGGDGDMEASVERVRGHEDIIETMKGDRKVRGGGEPGKVCAST